MIEGALKGMGPARRRIARWCKDAFDSGLPEPPQFPTFERGSASLSPKTAKQILQIVRPCQFPEVRTELEEIAHQCLAEIDAIDPKKNR